MRAPGSFSVWGLSWGMGTWGRAEVSPQSSALAWQGLPTSPRDLSRFSWVWGWRRVVPSGVSDPEPLLKLCFPRPSPRPCPLHLCDLGPLRSQLPPFTFSVPQVSNQGQSLNTLGSAFLNIMWPHEIANGKWLLYPMRVELEGGQGPGQKGLCSPRPNILHLVRQGGGAVRQGVGGVRLREVCHGGGHVWGGGGQEEGSGEEMPSQDCRIRRDSPGPFPHIQDVDSRDRRRRELEQPEQPEQQVPPEQQEPSTSWWPVSSAEKKKNITLVRAGQMCAGRMGVWGCDRMLGAWRFTQRGGCPGRLAC